MIAFDDTDPAAELAAQMAALMAGKPVPIHMTPVTQPDNLPPPLPSWALTQNLDPAQAQAKADAEAQAKAQTRAQLQAQVQAYTAVVPTVQTQVVPLPQSAPSYTSNDTPTVAPQAPSVAKSSSAGLWAIGIGSVAVVGLTAYFLRRKAA